MQSDAADILRHAAELLDEEFLALHLDDRSLLTLEFACVAITSAARLAGDYPGRPAVAFFDAFCQPGQTSGTIFSYDEDMTPKPASVSQPERIIALLLFAAAVEAGDFAP